MPILSLTVSTQVATRIQAAYGVGSLAELKNMIVADIKNKVANYEISLVERTEEVKRRTLDEARVVALETAQASAESEIILT